MSVSCPKCKHSNPEGSSFCEQCGFRLGDANNQPSSKEATQPSTSQDVKKGTDRFRFDPEDLYADTLVYGPDFVDVSHTTKIVLPEKIRISVSVDDYKSLVLAKKVEDLVVWNILNQIMLAGFFALLGVAVEGSSVALNTPFYVALMIVGIGAAVTTLAYWLSIYNAKKLAIHSVKQLLSQKSAGEGEE